jgi:DNA sulfur modification protein DndD
MEIKLKGWSSEGFRCPDANIDLSHNNGAYDLSFIQMPNGTGKTTTLLLLKACLSGNISNWSADDIYQLKKKNHPINDGKFTINLLVNNEVLSIELVVDFREKEVSFWTISPQGDKRVFRRILFILTRLFKKR